MADSLIAKKGYLNGIHRYFHLKDTDSQEYDFHFHDFDKLVILLSGHVVYVVEDKQYELTPGDFLLIGQHIIHKAVIDPSVPYERIILYLDRQYYSTILKNVDLCECFEIVARTGNYLFHPNHTLLSEIAQITFEYEKKMNSHDPWDVLIANGYIVNLLAHINKMISRTDAKAELEIYFDPRIKDTVQFISDHLSEKLTVNMLAERVFLSRYHFMRLFKTQMACSVTEYINQKRLLAAAHMIRAGHSATYTATELGFTDYSSFYRAFKKQFGVSPTDLVK